MVNVNHSPFRKPLNCYEKAFSKNKKGRSLIVRSADLLQLQPPTPFLELCSSIVLEPQLRRTESLIIDITHRCPFSCPSCIEREALAFSNKTELSVRTACRIIETFVNNGGKKVFFYGGEPTIHPGFSVIFRHTADLADEIVLVTNGSNLLLKEVHQAIAEVSVKVLTRIRVSLNAGTATSHAIIHRAEGFFDSVVTGMKQLVSGAPRAQLSVSFLAQESNVDELEAAFNIASSVSARVFAIRPMTGPHGIGLLPMRRQYQTRLLRALAMLIHNTTMENLPKIAIDAWYIRWLQNDVLPSTSKSYEMCHFCGSSRLVVTPPDPGFVWGCPYWRKERHFLLADLRDFAYGSIQFEKARMELIQKINPHIDCEGVICNRDCLNQRFWRDNCQSEDLVQ